MGQAHLVAVGGAGVTDADGFCGATLRFCHINVLLPRVVYRGQPKHATAGGKNCEMDFVARRGGPVCPPFYLPLWKPSLFPPFLKGGMGDYVNPGPKKKSPIPMDGTPFTIRSSLTYKTYKKPPGRSSGSRISRRRSAFPPGVFISPRQWPHSP